MITHRYYKSFIFGFIIVLILAYLSFKKHYISYSACYKLTSVSTPFYPDAYRFINTIHEFDVVFKSMDTTYNLETFFDSCDIDLNSYTYLIVVGAPIKEMYYSYVTTVFADKSPDYAKAIRKNKKCVFIDYYPPTGHVYIYRIKQDLSLSGFDGL